MFSLKELLRYRNIVIQCHDCPDADTIASALAVHTYLRENGIASSIVYSGPEKISRRNLLSMIEILAIPIMHVESLPTVGALIMVDCQYGAGNVTQFPVSYERIYVIDHHEVQSQIYKGIIGQMLGSCSTLMWALLQKEGFDFNRHPLLSTALYYGLYTDTNNLDEISHPLDKDMRDHIKADLSIIEKLKFKTLTMNELNIATAALFNRKVDAENNFVTIKADACDQHLLGFISDFVLHVEDVDACLVYTTLPDGHRLVVRSCTRNIMAYELASFIAQESVDEIKGNNRKARGIISNERTADSDIDSYIASRISEYFNSYDLIDAANHDLRTSSMSKYTKRKVTLGYVRTTSVFKEGTPVLIRTLEGDLEVQAANDICLLIGLKGEVYPIKWDKFLQSYSAGGQGFIRNFDYLPMAKSKVDGISVVLTAHAQPCTPTGRVHINAMPLERNTKVFTSWNPEGYYYGKAGDYIVVRDNDRNDVYIIKKDIFEETHDKV